MYTQEQLASLYVKYADLNPVIVQLSTQKSFGSKIIRMLSWSEYSHADIVLPDGTLLGARTNGGVQVRPANYGNFTVQDNFIVSRKLTGGPEFNPADVFAYAKSQIGKPYDWRGIINFGIHTRKWHDDRQWFCSELVGEAFYQAGHPVVNIPSYDRLTPRDLSLSPYLTNVEALIA